MNSFNKKTEVGFSIIWIVIYVVGFSVAENISSALGVMNAITLPFCIIMAFFLFLWIRNNKLQGYYGLCKLESSTFRKFLYFIPLIILSTTNFWNGVEFRFSTTETFLYVCSMLFVGFIEEVIFRGFLFQSLARDNLKMAIVISSLSFGLGHIVNLLNGADILSTVLQICYATAVGYLFTVIFMKGKSLLPCIIAHAFINSTSAFAVVGDERTTIISTAILIVIAVGYAIFLTKSKMGDE